MSVKVVFLGLAMLAAPAWAINKCTGADGKVVFQDAPCLGRGEVIEIRPASGPARAAAPVPAVQVSPAAAAQKEGAFGPSWQRRTYLENLGIASARGAVEQHQRKCEAKQAELANRKRQANNNLAGATWEQSISTEMQAAATACDSRERQLRAELDSLEKELRELQAKQ